MNHGYLRVAAAVPKVNVADVDYNIASIEAITAETAAIGASVIVFPELLYFHEFGASDSSQLYRAESWRKKI